MYVQKQSAAILTAFSKYAACSHVSYQEQLPVWEVLGREIYTEYDKLYSSYKEEFEKLRQLGDDEDDIEELDSSESEKEEEEAAKKKPKKGLFGRKEKKEDKKKKEEDSDDDDDVSSISEVDSSVSEVDSISSDVDEVSDSDSEEDL